MNFNKAIQILLDHEGGYSNNPYDPGGETNYGVTKRVAENYGYTGSMRDIPLSVVKDIYRSLYWTPCQCSSLPESVRFDVFDGAVNSGVKRSVKWLQKSCGATVDGIVGMETIRLANSSSGLKARYNGERLAFLTELGHWDDFGRGWARRVADNLRL